MLQLNLCAGTRLELFCSHTVMLYIVCYEFPVVNERQVFSCIHMTSAERVIHQVIRVVVIGITSVQHFCELQLIAHACHSG